MTTRLLAAENIQFERGNKTILKNASIEISAGEIVTLIGPNGAGKSTLIRILLGLIKADSGNVHKEEDLVVGYMPQKLSVDNSLPLNVKHFLKLSGCSDQQAVQALSKTGADHLLTYKVHTLSGGEWQRVLLARALVRQPQLLVLDEPVQGVDVTGQAALYKLIQTLRDETGCGVLMISHDLHLVMAATDRVICLNQHICCEGHPDSVSVHPEFLQLFGEQKDSRIAVYTHNHDHTHDCGDHTHTHNVSSDGVEK